MRAPAAGVVRDRRQRAVEGWRERWYNGEAGHFRLEVGFVSVVLAKLAGDTASLVASELALDSHPLPRQAVVLGDQASTSRLNALVPLLVPGRPPRECLV